MVGLDNSPDAIGELCILYATKLGGLAAFRAEDKLSPLTSFFINYVKKHPKLEIPRDTF